MEWQAKGKEGAEFSTSRGNRVVGQVTCSAGDKG